MVHYYTMATRWLLIGILVLTAESTRSTVQDDRDDCITSCSEEISSQCSASCPVKRDVTVKCSDYCETCVDAKPTECSRKQIFRPDGDPCGCCDVCVTPKGVGELCGSQLRMIIDQDSINLTVESAECGPALECMLGVCRKVYGRCQPEDTSLGFRSQCDNSGLYYRQQCNDSYCYCVDIYKGMVIYDTEVEVKNSDQSNCMCLTENLNTMDTFAYSPQKPACDDLGNYWPVQCSTWHCWCVNSATGEPISGTKVRIPQNHDGILTCEHLKYYNTDRKNELPKRTRSGVRLGVHLDMSCSLPNVPAISPFDGQITLSQDGAMSKVDRLTDGIRKHPKETSSSPENVGDGSYPEEPGMVVQEPIMLLEHLSTRSPYVPNPSKTRVGSTYAEQVEPGMSRYHETTTVNLQNMRSNPALLEKQSQLPDVRTIPPYDSKLPNHGQYLSTTRRTPRLNQNAYDRPAKTIYESIATEKSTPQEPSDWYSLSDVEPEEEYDQDQSMFNPTSPERQRSRPEKIDEQPLSDDNLRNPNRYLSRVRNSSLQQNVSDQPNGQVYKPLLTTEKPLQTYFDLQSPRNQESTMQYNLKKEERNPNSNPTYTPSFPQQNYETYLNTQTRNQPYSSKQEINKYSSYQSEQRKKVAPYEEDLPYDPITNPEGEGSYYDGDYLPEQRSRSSTQKPQSSDVNKSSFYNKENTAVSRLDLSEDHSSGISDNENLQQLTTPRTTGYTISEKQDWPSERRYTEDQTNNMYYEQTAEKQNQELGTKHGIVLNQNLRSPSQDRTLTAEDFKKKSVSQSDEESQSSVTQNKNVTSTSKQIFNNRQQNTMQNAPVRHNNVAFSEELQDNSTPFPEIFNSAEDRQVLGNPRKINDDKSNTRQQFTSQQRHESSVVRSDGILAKSPTTKKSPIQANKKPMSDIVEDSRIPLEETPEEIQEFEYQKETYDEPSNTKEQFGSQRRSKITDRRTGGTFTRNSTPQNSPLQPNEEIISGDHLESEIPLPERFDSPKEIEPSGKHREVYSATSQRKSEIRDMESGGTARNPTNQNSPMQSNNEPFLDERMENPSVLPKMFQNPEETEDLGSEEKIYDEKSNTRQTLTSKNIYNTSDTRSGKPLAENPTLQNAPESFPEDVVKTRKPLPKEFQNPEEVQDLENRREFYDQGTSSGQQFTSQTRFKATDMVSGGTLPRNPSDDNSPMQTNNKPFSEDMMQNPRSRPQAFQRHDERQVLENEMRPSNKPTNTQYQLASQNKYETTATRSEEVFAKNTTINNSSLDRSEKPFSAEEIDTRSAGALVRDPTMQNMQIQPNSKPFREDMMKSTGPRAEGFETEEESQVLGSQRKVSNEPVNNRQQSSSQRTYKTTVIRSDGSLTRDPTYYYDQDSLLDEFENPREKEGAGNQRNTNDYTSNNGQTSSSRMRYQTTHAQSGGTMSRNPNLYNSPMQLNSEPFPDYITENRKPLSEEDQNEEGKQIIENQRKSAGQSTNTHQRFKSERRYEATDTRPDGALVKNATNRNWQIQSNNEPVRAGTVRYTNPRLEGFQTAEESQVLGNQRKVSDEPVNNRQQSSSQRTYKTTVIRSDGSLTRNPTYYYDQDTMYGVTDDTINTEEKQQPSQTRVQSQKHERQPPFSSQSEYQTYMYEEGGNQNGKVGNPQFEDQITRVISSRRQSHPSREDTKFDLVPEENFGETTKDNWSQQSKTSLDSQRTLQADRDNIYSESSRGKIRSESQRKGDKMLQSLIQLQNSDMTEQEHSVLSQIVRQFQQSRKYENFAPTLKETLNLVLEREQQISQNLMNKFQSMIHQEESQETSGESTFQQTQHTGNEKYGMMSGEPVGSSNMETSRTYTTRQGSSTRSGTETGNFDKSTDYETINVSQVHGGEMRGNESLESNATSATEEIKKKPNVIHYKRDFARTYKSGVRQSTEKSARFYSESSPTYD